MHYHILGVGSFGHYSTGFISLENVYNIDNTYPFNHAKTHPSSRDRFTVKELADLIRIMSSNLCKVETTAYMDTMGVSAENDGL